MRAGGVLRAAAAAGRPTVGFVGAGQMGSHMARHLVRAGHDVVVFDVHEPAVAALVAAGARGAGSAREAVREAGVVVSMLPSSPHVAALFADVGPELRPGTLCLECSTIEPGVARAVARAAAERGADMVDAPVSGGTGGAEKGTLTFMVGGPAAALERARPYLNVMGSKVVHCGEAGAGQTAKICNNLVLAISMCGVSEAMNLGVRLGMDPAILADIINSSSGRCWSSDTYNPVPGVMPAVPASRDYQGGFAVDLMSKDVSLAISAAHEIKAPLPLGAASQQLYNNMSAHGHGRLDFSSVYAFLANALGRKQ